jgi:D-3-phosphoglycerate dehydrogenase
MNPTVLSLIKLPPATVRALQDTFGVCTQGDNPRSAVVPPGSREAIRAVVTNGTTGMAAQQMDELPNLEIICVFGAGYEGVDLVAAQARGIVVTHAPGTNTATVADHAMGFLLALTRRHETLTGEVRKGNWKTSRNARPTLHGSSIGILGMGRVGSLVARRAAAFDMTVRYSDVMERPDVAGTFCADVQTLARESDFLVATCPGGEATYHIVDRSVLRALGPRGYLVNVSRGSVVNTDDLVLAIQAEEIAGAGLDVIETEPEVPAALLESDRVLLTPHVAGRSPASQLAQQDTLMENLKRRFSGRTVQFVVPPR